MSHIRVVICHLDDPATDQMTELAAFDLPAPDVATLEPTTALDNLETVTQQTGNAILRQLLQAQWDVIDAALLAQHRQHCSSQALTADGHEMVTVASRDPILPLARQVCQQSDPLTHVLPGNAVLPLHPGMIITRGLHLLGLPVTAGGALRLCGSAAGVADPPSADPWGDDCT